MDGLSGDPLRRTIAKDPIEGWWEMSEETFDTGLRDLSLHDTAQNQIWLEIVSLALDLRAWMPVLALTGETRRWEPKRPRLRLFSAAAQLLTTGGTRRPPAATT